MILSGLLVKVTITGFIRCRVLWQLERVENAGMENVGPKLQGGTCRTDLALPENVVCVCMSKICCNYRGAGISILNFWGVRQCP